MAESIPSPLEWVFLDAGDTLLAPYPTFERRFLAVAEEHGERHDVAAVEAAIAATARRAIWPTDWTDPATQRSFWSGFYMDVFAELGFTDAARRVELAEAMYAVFSDPATYKLFDDVRPALAALAERGLQLGVISNFEPWLRDVLRLEGVEELFGVVAISGVLGVAKPDPAIFRAALAEAGAAPSSAIHVGDQLTTDVDGARAVGITPVLIDRFDRRADVGVLRVRDLVELVALIDQGAAC